MKLKPLGHTGCLVSPMGLGLAALGRPGYINLGHGTDLAGRADVAGMEANAHAVLDAAWEKGIRYVDAARSYGKAEAFLASWLDARHIPEKEVAVGSKWGYRYTADWQVTATHHEIKEHTLDHFSSQWEESRALLGKHLDLYQIHSATLESGVLTDTRLLALLFEAKQAHGVLMGLSLSGPLQARTLAEARKIRFDGLPLFDAVQATCNLLEPSAQTALAEASDAGMGIIIKEALANGRLTDRNTHPGFSRQTTMLATQAERLSCSIDALAMAWLLSKPWADVVLSGATTTEHLLSNLKALDVAWDAEAEEALAPLAESPEAYWAFRKGLAWN
ncbi:aldo/keto reductase [Desulfoluna spongiiphila]|uniref:Predicted oxidoreductase n=1 Tax=Desulfoluna spongiiphila TaxID=419481 RepID=A0A1G5FL40_9BACT|nr:aldo/keto reductase [Desulfoluna spongiiphila]SCY39871.1 Predicted oxidoreductase [Desulfoluna spongiiphila]